MGPGIESYGKHSLKEVEHSSGLRSELGIQWRTYLWILHYREVDLSCEFASIYSRFIDEFWKIISDPKWYEFRKKTLFYVKFPVESRDDLVFWICEIFIEIFGKSHQICRFWSQKVYSCGTAIQGRLSPFGRNDHHLKRLQEDILFVSELLLDPELLSVLFQIFWKFSQNLYLCSVLNSLEELYWTLGWFESPRSERSAA